MLEPGEDIIDPDDVGERDRFAPRASNVALRCSLLSRVPCLRSLLERSSEQVVSHPRTTC